MSTAFYLIPGARLPEALAQEFLRTIRPEEKSALEALGLGAENPVFQEIAPAPYERAPHYVWLWRVLAREEGLPAEAPWAWAALGGPDQSVEMWTLDALGRNAEGGIEGIASGLSDRDFLSVTMPLLRIVEAEGFRLQMSDNRWFLTCRNAWDVKAAPAKTLTGLSALPPLTGADAQRARALLEKLHATLSSPEAVALNGRRRAEGLPTLDFFWMHGGGENRRFYPPTKIRSVAADDPVLRGWAEAAGILRQRLGSTAQTWPEAPEGDLIVVFEDLYDAWLSKDLQGWRAALPRLTERVTAWKSAAEARKSEDAVTVLFGHGTSATLTPKEGALFGLLKNKKSVDPATWLADRPARGE